MPAYTEELGYAAGLAPATVGGRNTGTYTVEGLEQTPELMFPASSSIYDRIRRTDGQLAGVLRALTLPMRAAGRRLVGDDVRPQVTTFLEAELGLGGTAGRQRHRRQGIVFGEHLRDALLMLPFGFMPFEPVYEVGPPNPGAPVNDLTEVAHLRKLAPRMPRSLAAVEVRRDGGLAAIVQAAPPGATPQDTPGLDTARGGIVIDVDRLVVYVNDREGADWTGTSVLRSAYKHWLIKDALLRLGPMIVERNGMGVPVVTGPENGRAKGLAMARAFRAGADAGVYLEDGFSVTLVGTQGSTKDELPLVKYHDEAASRSLLAMFLDLGHDNGARALGDTFVDYFLLAGQTVLGNVEETFTEHVIRDLVELNFGPDEPYPSLKFDDLSSEASPTAVALKTLADAKLITPDGTLEDELRRRYSLPASDPSTRPAPPAAPETFQPAGTGPEGPPSLIPVVDAPAVTAASAGDDLLERLAALNERVLATRTA